MPFAVFASAKPHGTRAFARLFVHAGVRFPRPFAGAIGTLFENAKLIFPPGAVETASAAIFIISGTTGLIWQCSERYKVKGVMGCANRHVEEETLIKAYLMAWNALVENREDFMEQWTEQLQSENLLEGYRAEKFIEYTDGAEPLTEMDTDFMLKTLDHIKVFEDGTLLVVFLDGTEIECKNEEE